MKREYSAGGIVVTKTTKGWYVLLIEDMKGRWTFPKGLIERNEEPAQAAKREVAEEAGITDQLVLIKPLAPIEYFYFREGTIKKTVRYFLFESARRARPTAQKEEGIARAKWIPLAKALELVDYEDTNVPLLRKAMRVLKQKNNNNYGNS